MRDATLMIASPALGKLIPIVTAAETMHRECALTR